MRAGVCGLKQGDSDVGAVGQGLVENSDTESQPYTSYHYVAPEEHLLDKPVGRHDPDLAACVGGGSLSPGPPDWEASFTCSLPVRPPVRVQSY